MGWMLVEDNHTVFELLDSDKFLQVLKVCHAGLLCCIVGEHTIEVFTVCHDAAEDGQAGTTSFVQRQLDGIVCSLPRFHVVVP